MQQVDERPLRLIVRICGFEGPSRTESIDQILDGCSPGYARRGRIGVQPKRIGVASEVIRSELADSPANDGSRCRWKSQPKGAAEGADGKVGKRGLDIAAASKLDGFQTVNEAGEDEEYGNPGVPLGHEPEDGSLEEEDGLLVGCAARDDETSCHTEDHVTRDHEEGGHAAKTLFRDYH